MEETTFEKDITPKQSAHEAPNGEVSVFKLEQRQ